MNRRSDEIATLIQRELADLVRTRLQDPGIGYVTITRVEVTKDLRSAKVFISEMVQDEKKAGRSMEALGRATGFLRTQLGQRLRLPHTPELRFVADSSIEEGSRMFGLLDRIAEELPPLDDQSEGETPSQ